MARRPRADGGVGRPAGRCRAASTKAGTVPEGRVARDDEDLRSTREQRDGLQVAQRIVRQARHHRLRGGDGGVGAEAEGMAVGRARSRLRADPARGPRAVLDHRGTAERGGKVRRDGPHQGVRRAAGREGDDQAYGPWEDGAGCAAARCAAPARMAASSARREGACQLGMSSNASSTPAMPCRLASCRMASAPEMHQSQFHATL